MRHTQIHSHTRSLSRRDFLRAAGLGLGALVLPSGLDVLSPLSAKPALAGFPVADRLGRIAVGKVDLKARPDLESETVGALYEDQVIAWLREVSGTNPAYVFNNQRWVETSQGFIYGPYVQPVANLPNIPQTTLTTTSLGDGFWAEVTIPYADAFLDRSASSNSWVSARLEQGLPLRFYYSQVFWVDQIRSGEGGQVYYRVNPNYYGGVDKLWAAAEAFRPLAAADLAPIHPGVADKRIEVNVTQQTVSCFEGAQEVFFCRAATGAKYDMYGKLVDYWATPLGDHRVTRKFVSLQMSGGTTGAPYDIPGIGWTSIFATGGVAIHSTFWHNNFGDPVSHGCVNVSPRAAQWIFRWAEPVVPYDPGMLDVTLTGQASTLVKIVED